ncbi:MAG: hypothetical protein QXP77_00070 [Candidatus Aenigmatarchaeota archaeon]
MESKKGIAIPYIIALVIGIIVLVFIVYWLYRLFGPGPITAEQCRSLMIQWCNACKNLGWSGGNAAPECVSGYPEIVGGYISNLANCDYTANQDVDDACRAVGISVP